METPHTQSTRVSVHTPVLLHEVITVLNLVADDVVVDATLGGGGHAEAILALLGKNGRYIGIDADAAALERVRVRIGHDPRVTLVQANFRTLADVLNTHQVSRVTKILFDLGLSSDQLTGSVSGEGRGFSFSRDEPLLMTLDNNPTSHTLTAQDIVNEWSEESLADVLYGFGGERHARKIARAIVDERELRPIQTTYALTAIIERVIPAKGWRTHPATKTFQALRIAVNDELGALEEALRTGLEVLAPLGRIAVITFHSLEDRTVKQLFKAFEDAGSAVRVTKKPIPPTREEVRSNRRARSAKLRCLEKNA
jgi:16S rRNA (cytosine1402-N4)-methyltransferase